MRGGRAARLLLPPAVEGGGVPEPRRLRRGRSRSFVPGAWPSPDLKARRREPAAPSRTATAGGLVDSAGDRLFEALREHRLQVAREQSVPAYFVASDRTLREMAEARPRTAHDLASIYGMGPARVEKYGRGFLDVIARHLGP